MSSSLDSAKQITNPLSHFLSSISSYDGNVMLAAVISLLLVILFVLLLHLYAKWFLAQACQRRRASMSVSRVLGPDRFHHFHSFTFDTTFPSSPSKGLDSSAISSIPLFVYKTDEHKHGLECVICLSAFEDNDVGRHLPKCRHAFHLECIDMWLQSHSNCPICRAPLGNDNKSNAIVALADGAEAMSPTDQSNGESMQTVNGEAGVTNGDSRLEILTDLSDCDNGRGAGEINIGSLSASSSSLDLSSSLGCSLKRMLSRNKSERKVFPSSNVSELEV